MDGERLFIYLGYAPGLIAGAFGGWGLGWLDAPMPEIVVAISFSTAFALVIIGLREMRAGKALALGLLATSLFGIPTWVAVTGVFTVSGSA